MLRRKWRRPRKASASASCSPSPTRRSTGDRTEPATPPPSPAPGAGGGGARAMPDLAELVTQLLNGVVLGLLYAIIALGFMLILGTMEVINFCHGVLFALGGYSALALGPHVGWWGALLLAPLIVGGVGLLLELGVRRTYGRD